MDEEELCDAGCGRKAIWEVLTPDNDDFREVVCAFDLSGVINDPDVPYKMWGVYAMDRSG